MVINHGWAAVRRPEAGLGRLGWPGLGRTGSTGSTGVIWAITVKQYGSRGLT